VIRPRALGKFEDLLEATAHSPAMLLYLDNSSSMGPDSPAAEKPKMRARNPNAKKKAPEGLNENYARELMELHTLGVNGGYTQADVTQVARVLTGWTVDRPQRGGGFKFDENRHEPGAKKVLGKKIKEHGEQEGRELLHMLATRPATAQFISANSPSASSATIPRRPRRSHGQVLLSRRRHLRGAQDALPLARVLVRRRLSRQGQNAARVRRLRRPRQQCEYRQLQPLVNALRDMGMPLYGASRPPATSGTLHLGQHRRARQPHELRALLAANKLPGIAITWSAATSFTHPNEQRQLAGRRRHPQPRSSAHRPASLPTPDAEEQRLESLLVAGGVSESTRTAVLEQFQTQSQPKQRNECHLPECNPQPKPLAARSRQAP
jgi:hypothetical protein